MKLFTIFDYYWQNVAGSREFDNVLNAMTTYIKVEGFDQKKGLLHGQGLWGNESKKWSINFGENFDKLEFDCECPQIHSRGKSDSNVPCSHCIRALITLESKLKKKSYEDIHAERLSNVIPF